jgi:hypothetical protein
LASVPHSFKQERATVPPIVLPITSRGIALTDRVCWGILGAAMVGAAALFMYLSRGTVFYADELSRVLAAPTFDLHYVFQPHAGHLTATSNVVVQGMLELFGPDYLAFRVLGLVPVLLCVALLYAVAKRRIGAIPALAPALVLLFFGSAWELVLIPFGFAVIFGTALGLAALLALDRDDRAGDVAACAFLSLSVVTFSVGLAFVVGVAISVLLRRDRWRRAWIFLVPAGIYVAWWLWALSSADSSGDYLRAVNILQVPHYVADSLAAVSAAITGLGYSFTNPEGNVEIGSGRVVAVIAVVALVLRIWRGRVPESLWASLGIALTLWTLAGLVSGALRDPSATRYMFAGAVAVLLVATDAARSVRFSRRGLAVLFAACAFSLATNIALLRDGASFIRDYSAVVRADLAMAELAGDRADPDLEPLRDEPFGEAFFNAPITISDYLAVVDEFGPIGFSPSELEGQLESTREGADRVLAGAYRLRLTTSAKPPPVESCRVVKPMLSGGPIVAELPAGGAAFRARGADGDVRVGRFGTIPSVEVGTASRDATAAVRIPTDSAPQPWRALVTGPRSLEVCGLR